MASESAIPVEIEKQREVELHWNSQPCDADKSGHAVGTREYYLDIERDRYSLQSHVLELLGWVNWKDKQTLEIGAGVGTDARSIIARGGRYTGINVDRASTEIATRSLAAFGLPGTVQQASATALPFLDASFDVVYSFGVIHHIPAVDEAVAEIRRVLKPGGELVLMVYNRTSINYYVEIMFLRKLLRRALILPGMIPLLSALGLPRNRLEGHRKLLGTGKMSGEEWLSRNTDGPDNPYSKVYGAREIEQLLRGFRVERNEARFFDYRHWGVLGWALPRSTVEAFGRRWGWHRVVYARKPEGQ